MKGYVLDGYPENENQCIILEKYLTGLDIRSENMFNRNASKVLPPSETQYQIDLNRELDSGLDCIFYLNIKNDKISLERQSDKTFQQYEINQVYKKI